MDELFGMPTERLTLVLLAIFTVGGLILAFLAVRDRVAFKMAMRNASRRKTQTALIVMGLMLATLLFSAAFTTGDTLTNSLRAQALENIGRVDVTVKAEQPEAGSGAAFGPDAGGPAGPEARERYFDENLAGQIRDRLSGAESVTGVAPLAKETVPVTSLETDLSEPRVDVLGMDTGSMEGFDRLMTRSGKTLSVGDLGNNEVYVSQGTAEGLGVGADDKIEASLIRPTTEPKAETPSGTQSERRPGRSQGRPGVQGAGNPPAGFESGSRPPRVTDNERPTDSEAGTLPAEPREQSPPELMVAGIYESGANPASDISMVMPLGDLQKRVGEEARINDVLVTHRGPAVEGGRYTNKTVDEIQPILSSNNLEADPVKKDAVEGADQREEIFSTLFVLFGQFSVATGMLLIFLIFVMLAAERKHELGIAGAVGMQHSHPICMFAFEGALYAMVASALGSVAGVAALYGNVAGVPGRFGGRRAGERSPTGPAARVPGLDGGLRRGLPVAHVALPFPRRRVVALRAQGPRRAPCDPRSPRAVPRVRIRQRYSLPLHVRRDRRSGDSPDATRGVDGRRHHGPN